VGLSGSIGAAPASIGSGGKNGLIASNRAKIAQAENNRCDMANLHGSRIHPFFENSLNSGVTAVT
jgi:hypothetical protein